MGEDATSGRTGDERPASRGQDAGGERAASPWAGVVFAVALGALVVLLAMGYTVFRAVSLALLALLLVAAARRDTRVSLAQARTAFTRSAAGGFPSSPPPPASGSSSASWCSPGSAPSSRG